MQLMITLELETQFLVQDLDEPSYSGAIEIIRRGKPESRLSRHHGHEKQKR